jgi:hypothetical protein
MALGTQRSGRDDRHGPRLGDEPMSQPMRGSIVHGPGAPHALLLRGRAGSQGMMRMGQKGHTLVGNSFPLSLITRRVVIEPASVQDLQVAAADRHMRSFWGHANTLVAAETAMGIALAPQTERPVLVLDEEGHPSLAGMSFEECWVVTPIYVDTFRPKVGEEVPLARIRNWQVLRMRWENA